ncbi:hypothetical protein LMG28614_00404 [Paraburkholderia ultramafica]|uniref:Uncharacterized protein n=1 Tax=Paraburkholderia ultramafica TaxID=1544867 RepID=A0A6S7AW60_9BURK|nr:hypothetical protein [Paraburkholderia ultramafica]CAB3777514.1 hypothetical protein LMG28614_00404 [Paraburkholderia ultramafica]
MEKLRANRGRVDYEPMPARAKRRRNGRMPQSSVIALGTPDARSPSYSNFDTKGDHIMPYLIGWLLGVPLIVLVILYLIFH